MKTSVKWTSTASTVDVQRRPETSGWSTSTSRIAQWSTSTSRKTWSKVDGWPLRADVFITPFTRLYCRVNVGYSQGKNEPMFMTILFSVFLGRIFTLQLRLQWPSQKSGRQNGNLLDANFKSGWFVFTVLGPSAEKESAKTVSQIFIRRGGFCLKLLPYFFVFGELVWAQGTNSVLSFYLSI